MERDSCDRFFTDYYSPLEAGYKDRSGVLPYDKAACRALESNYKPPSSVQGSAERTIFVARLARETEECDIEKAFGRFGTLDEIRLVRDLVTGAPRGYAFVVFSRRRDAAAARTACRRLCILGADVVVEAEFSRTMAGWKPRRLGGGLGGRKESGQLRFGGTARPFQLGVTGAAPAARLAAPLGSGPERHERGDATRRRDQDTALRRDQDSRRSRREDRPTPGHGRRAHESCAPDSRSLAHDEREPAGRQRGREQQLSVRDREQSRGRDRDSHRQHARSSDKRSGDRTHRDRPNKHREKKHRIRDE